MVGLMILEGRDGYCWCCCWCWWGKVMLTFEEIIEGVRFVVCGGSGSPYCKQACINRMQHFFEM